MHNAAAYAMIEKRFSNSVKLFHTFPVSDADSDIYYYAVRDRLALAKVALERASEVHVTTLARSLGEIYRVVFVNLTPPEREQWEGLNEDMENLLDKYETFHVN